MVQLCTRRLTPCPALRITTLRFMVKSFFFVGSDVLLIRLEVGGANSKPREGCRKPAKHQHELFRSLFCIFAPRRPNNLGTVCIVILCVGKFFDPSLTFLYTACALVGRWLSNSSPPLPRAHAKSPSTACLTTSSAASIVPASSLRFRPREGTASLQSERMHGVPGGLGYLGSRQV